MRLCVCVCMYLAYISFGLLLKAYYGTKRIIIAPFLVVL